MYLGFSGKDGRLPARAGLSAIVVALMVAASGTTAAGDLVYTPINPSFGGSPLNSSHLLSLANAQREATASDADDGLGSAGTVTDTETSDADLFVRQLQGRLLSALAAQVTEAIFGTDPQDGGLITFGDTTVAFERTLDSIALTITNTLDGTVTQIVVPQLLTSNN
ncbi:curli assembly protein CsgF [Hoeflea ulvae]|uniref:Curli production assembly/transport component CsgF n=1 Tax=Hoeflea ulvae TaxID=2983764 RepID=A0ABT3YDS8_9HYPH|nr:curli assembly protein CsgF [Hoeflea ulvae]MCY0094039.1 curli assembly protein CsgF [Hoeflea ulvae]